MWKVHWDHCKGKGCEDFYFYFVWMDWYVYVCACVFVWFCDSVLLIVKQRTVCWMCKWLMVKRYQRFLSILYSGMNLLETMVALEMVERLTHGKSLTNFVCIIRFIPNWITQCPMLLQYIFLTWSYLNEKKKE